VFGAMVRLASLTGADGLLPLTTALEDEGFGALDAERIVAGFARHLMVALDRWREGDFAGLARDYIGRLPRERGVLYTIDGGGDLRIERLGKPTARRELCVALNRPSWLDPATGAPRL